MSSQPIQLPIVCDRVTLRRVEDADIDDLFAIYGDPEVGRYELWEEPLTREDARWMIEDQAEVEPGDLGVPLKLAVVLHGEGRVIGDCLITVVSDTDRQGEIGYSFKPHYQGQGFATEAVRATLGFGFGQLHLHRITATTDVRNERSMRLLERLGMRREAHFRQTCFVRGAWVDDYVYAMLEDEWRAMANG